MTGWAATTALRSEMIMKKSPKFEPVNISVWGEFLLFAGWCFVMGIAFALNFPEPVDCGPDHDAATLAEGCAQ